MKKEVWQRNRHLRSVGKVNFIFCVVGKGSRGVVMPTIFVQRDQVRDPRCVFVPKWEHDHCSFRYRTDSSRYRQPDLVRSHPSLNALGGPLVFQLMEGFSVA